MVISAEPPPPDPVADAAVAAAVEAASTGTSSARQAAFSSFPSLKAWGSHRVLRYGHVNRGGDAIATARRPAEQLREVGEKLLRHHDEVEAAGCDAPAADPDADHAAAEEAPAASPSKVRTPRHRRRRGAAVLPASASPPAERRPLRAVRGEHLDRRPRFSVTLTTEEIDEDIYAFTGARARRRPRRRPRPVQKQLDVSAPLPPSFPCTAALVQGPVRNFVKPSRPQMLFPGSWLSEITAETYRVPDDR
jgi:hypothetical protein